MIRLRAAMAAGVAVLLIAAAALAAPLWVYAISLALFGLPHVLVELRYVDQRFAARLPRWVVVWFAVGLLAVAALRALAFAGVDLGIGLARPELALGVGLVAILVPIAAARAAAATAALAFFVGAALLWGLIYAPIPTLVTLALLHNLTPIGFLAERLRGRERAVALSAAAIVFVFVPALMVALPLLPVVATGPFATGDLAQHLHAFVPQAWIGSAVGERLFAAAAFLQVMHHATVIGVLPRLGGGAETQGAVLSWPSRRAFALGVGTLGALAAVAFTLDFGSARSGYGIVAAVHAWVEIPVLLAACALAPAAMRQPALPDPAASASAA